MKHIKEFGYFDSVTARYGQLVDAHVVPKGRDKTNVVSLRDVTIREIVCYGKRTRKMDEPSPAEVLGLE